MAIVTYEYLRGLNKYNSVYFSCEHGPFGPVWLASTSFGICKLCLAQQREAEFLDWLSKTFPQADLIYDGDRHKPVVLALTQYAAGERHELELPLHLIGTEFQLRVWEELLKVPYGKTRTYAELANIIGSHPRAVGQANAKNPIAILVPCHRIIGKTGNLTGYAGGLELKNRLLALEDGARDLL